VGPEMIEPADPTPHDVLMPAARRERRLARHDEAIEPGNPRFAERVVSHRVMVTAWAKWRKG